MSVRSSLQYVVAVIGAAGLLAGAGSLAAAKNARAVFGETVHNFGKVKQGDVLTYEFAFKNTGNADLLVERVETSCGCTAALVSADKIPPGAAGKIKATFDSHSYTGPVTKLIYFISNDSETKRRELRITAEIEAQPQPKIELDKYNMDLGVSLEGESPAAKVVVKNVGERELRVEIEKQDITFLSGGKPLALPLLIPVGKSAEIEFRLPAQMRPGVFRDYVLIRSNDPVRSTLSVYVSRYVLTKKDLKDLFEKYRTVLNERK